MELELKHLSAYLPYEVNCQYQGIINGKEIAKHRKDFLKENHPFTNWEYYTPIEEKKGLKIAPLKTIRTYKKYWVATCGIYNNGQKNFYNGVGIKLILRPLDLTKEIEHNGKKFVPIEELFEIAYPNNKGKKYFYDFQSNYIRCSHIGTTYYKMIYTNYELIDKNFFGDIEKLKEWHFDIYGLIDEGLAIDINTIEK